VVVGGGETGAKNIAPVYAYAVADSTNSLSKIRAEFRVMRITRVFAYVSSRKGKLGPISRSLRKLQKPYISKSSALI